MPAPISGNRPSSPVPGGSSGEGAKVPVDQVRAYLGSPAAASLPPALRRALEGAVASAANDTVILPSFETFGAPGAAAKKALTEPPAPADPPATSGAWSAPATPGRAWGAGAVSGGATSARSDGFASTGPRTGATSDSILNPAGMGNVSGAASVLNNIPNMPTGRADLERLRLDGTNAVKDPNTVMTAATSGSAVQAIKDIVSSGNPKAAELVAKELASRYGAFSASNSPANRAAILDALTWIADTSQGIRYNTPRAGQPDPTTQSPNETLATRSGVCRDIHVGTAAILASLMNAHPDGTGKMVPGSPNGREGDVQSIGFNNPTEYHDFMAYRDPATGRWNTLEYEKRYDLQAETAIDAMRQTTGSLTGFTRYTLNGWDGKPTVNSEGAVGAARSNAFMAEDQGVGVKGEIRTRASATDVSVTGFVTKNVSLTGAVDPSAIGNGLRGGIKVNYHKDFETADTQGYLRVAGGITSDFAESSKWTGDRSSADRAKFQTYVLAVKIDGRLEGKERELLKNHLKATWGVDIDALGGLPVAAGGGTVAIPLGAITDYSKLNLGADGGLSGHEKLDDHLTLDWAVRARVQVDAIAAGTELLTSQGTAASRTLLKDPVRAEVAMALTHRSDKGIITRIEAGGTTLIADPYDTQTNANEVHHAVLTVSPNDGVVNFGLVARGETLDKKFIPVNSLGVAVDFRPNKNVTVGLGASTVFPDGNIRNLGNNVQVMGSVAIHF